MELNLFLKRIMILIKVNILNELCIFDMSQIENDEKILIVLFNLLMLLDDNQNLNPQKKNKHDIRKVMQKYIFLYVKALYKGMI